MVISAARPLEQGALRSQFYGGERKEKLMRHSAPQLVRPVILRLAVLVALGAGVGAGLSACASDNPQPATSGTSVPVIGDWKRSGYKPDWSKPDFGGPPPGSH
jgi:hypothetical protein